MIDNHPLVSILVPVYKVEKYIERCARSLFEQTYDNIEYLFVDDCSPDNTIDILEEVVKDYPYRSSHIRIIHHDINRGLAAARNTAVSNCLTEWIMHVDSDDWLEPNTIELMINKQKETDADIVSAKVLRHTRTGDIELVVSDEEEKERFVLSTLGYDLHHILCGRLIRRSLYDVGEICAEEGTNLGEDWQVMPKLAWNAQSFAFLNAVTYYYNCNRPGSYTYDYFNFSNNFEQNYRSWIIINDFFSNKSLMFRQKVAQSGEILLFTHLHNATIQKNKRAFYYIKDKILELNPKAFKENEYCKGLRGIIKEHYMLYRLCVLGSKTVCFITSVRLNFSER